MTMGKFNRKAFGLVAVLLLVACSQEAPEKPSELLGKPAPDIAVQPLVPKGDIKLSSHRGKVVLLDFWATWCGPCVGAMPHLSGLQTKYDRKDFVIMGVTNETPGDVEKFLERNGKVDYDLFVDPESKAMLTYDAQSLPMSILIGRDGKVKHVEVGLKAEDPYDELDKAVEAAVNEK